MMGTLHGYVLRELLKAFALTLTALTVLFTMGGGMYNVVRYEGISAGHVINFMPVLIPMAITMTMPIAAVFAAALVYGRLAADNELLACRAAGINIHRMFRSALLLSIFVALFTFIMGNFVLPSAVVQLQDFARTNIRDLVAQQLQGKGFAHRGKSGEDRYTLTAERVQGVTEAALAEKGFETGPGLQHLLITNPTLLHLDRNGDLVRFAVARYGLCIFDARPDDMRFTLVVRDAQDYEMGKQAVTIAHQQIGPIPLPLPPFFRLAVADLRDLIRYRAAPWRVPPLALEVQHLRVHLGRYLFYRFLERQIGGDAPVVLTDDFGRTYRLTAARGRVDGGALELRDARVAVIAERTGRTTVYEAPRLLVKAGGVTPDELLIEMRLERTEGVPVLEYNPRAGDDAPPREKDALSLEGARVPETVLAELGEYPPEVVLDAEADLPGGALFADRRESLRKTAGHWERKIDATMHARLGYICSALLTVLMGAALGVVFRGARVLSAIALSMIPFFCVGVLIMLGNQLTKEAPTHQIGPLVIWGGLAALLLVDAAILRLGVRR
jgi:lipopolysaccharide export LptBFGC system permease protein LptF